MSVLVERIERIAGHRRCAFGSESRAGRPPLLRIGPGLILAIVVSVFIWNRMPRQPGPPPAPAGGQPQVVHETTPAPASLPSAPDPAWVVEHGRELELTPVQAAKLAKLKTRWDRDTRGLRESLAAAEADFQHQMQETEGQPVSMNALRERAGPVSDLSRQLADARQAWWSEAATVLTQDQRRQAETMWAKRFESPNQEEKTGP